jgi:probable HAF family extracellular repeat protein
MHRSIASLVLLAAAANAPAQVAFFGVGDLPGGGFLSECYAATADGRLVVGGSIVGGSGFNQIYDAFALDSETGMRQAFLAPAGSAKAYAVSADGSVIVGASDHGSFSELGVQAFVWTPSGAVEIGDLPGGASGVPRGYARGVSADGRWVVGIGESPSGTEAWRYDTHTGQFQGLGDLPGGTFASYAYAVSGDGSTIVGQSYAADGNQQAFRWSQGTGMVAMGYLPYSAGTTPASSAEAASFDGSVIVGWSRSSAAGNNGQEAYRWTAQTGMQPLGDLPGGAFQSWAYGVSADGRVVVGRASIAGTCGPFGCGSEGRAFVWTAADGMQNLQDLLASRGANVAGWRIQEARGVSADGRVVVGNGINPAGALEGWVAVLAPPPPVCDPDYNQDGNADQEDVRTLVGIIAGAPNPSGRDPDFNHDGNADQDDYIALVNVIAGGPCP